MVQNIKSCVLCRNYPSGRDIDMASSLEFKRLKSVLNRNKRSSIVEITHLPRASEKCGAKIICLHIFAASSEFGITPEFRAVLMNKCKGHAARPSTGRISSKHVFCYACLLITYRFTVLAKNIPS